MSDVSPAPKPNRLLKRARLSCFWTIAIAAEEVGVSLQTFSKWERGLQHPHPPSLKMLCEAFHMTPEELGFGDLIP